MMRWFRVAKRHVAVIFAGHAGLVALAVVLWMNATAGTSVAASVTPEQIAGNPTCGDVRAGLLEAVRVEPVENGTFPFTADGASHSVTLSNVTGTTFDWSSTLGMDVVVVKGGPNANGYTYDPPAESLGDTDLHAPINPANQQPYGLSHVSFCYDAGGATHTPPPTPTSPPPTPTPTSPPPTATTPPSTATSTPPGGVTATPTGTVGPTATEPGPTDTPESEVLPTAVGPTSTPRSEVEALPSSGSGPGGDASGGNALLLALLPLAAGAGLLGIWRWRLSRMG